MYRGAVSHQVRVMGLRYCPKTTSGSYIFTQNDSAGISYRQQIKVQIPTFKKPQKVSIWASLTFKIFQKNENVREMSQQQQKIKHNKNSENPLTSRRTDGGKKSHFIACTDKREGIEEGPLPD